MIGSVRCGIDLVREPFCPFSTACSFLCFVIWVQWETLDAERKPFVSLLPEISICFRRKCYDPTQPTDGELILRNFCGIPCLQIKKFKFELQGLVNFPFFPLIIEPRISFALRRRSWKPSCVFHCIESIWLIISAIGHLLYP